MKCLDIDAADIERMIANTGDFEARRKAARSKTLSPTVAAKREAEAQLPEWQRARLERRREQYRRAKRRARGCP
jgi:hypothetical protein